MRTPEKEVTGISKKSSNSDHENEDPDLSSRQRQKYLIELDKARRQDCQSKISDAVVKFLHVSNCLFQEKCHTQENFFQNTREELFKRAEEVKQKLDEFEQEQIRRNEQRIIENEQHAKRVLELNQILIREAEKRKQEEEERLQQEILLRKMNEEMAGHCLLYQSEFRISYGKFLEIMKLCKDKQPFITKVSNSFAKVKTYAQFLEDNIVDKCRSFTMNSQDVELCKRAVEEVRFLVEHSARVVEEINQDIVCIDEEKNRAAEEAASAAEEIEEEKPAPDVENEEEGLDEFVDLDAYQRYAVFKSFHEEFAKSYENLLKDERMKSFRFLCQKAVNIPVNAIAPSASHIQDKWTKLHRLLSGQTVEVNGTHFSASQHPQGVAFCKDLLAKKFVAQGGTTVSCKPIAAFPIAAVVLALWADFPDFGQLLLAQFHRECPYIVPIFMPQVEGQSNQDYYKTLGYHYSAEGEVEKQDQFLKRMAGIMHLYCAIIVTPLKRSISKPHPLGAREAWRWLACLVNTDPRPDICAILLYKFLEVAGHSMFIHYKHIFRKLLHLLCTEYFPKIQRMTPAQSEAPVVKLETFLQSMLKQGILSPPAGMLSPQFW